MDAKAIAYRVLRGRVDVLEKLVMQALAEGWQVQGDATLRRRWATLSGNCPAPRRSPRHKAKVSSRPPRLFHVEATTLTRPFLSSSGAIARMEGRHRSLPISTKAPLLVTRTLRLR
jgi:hypothetical protein